MSLAVILGGADCLWDDVDALRDLRDISDATIIAVNDAGIYWPDRIDHWVTGHPDELPYREHRREENGFPGGYETWTRPYPFGMKEIEKLCDHVLGGWNNGSSSFLAVGVAIETGHDRIVLCGVPMDARPHFNRSANWGGYRSYREAWIARQKQLDCVRSMSGWTKDLLGAPTERWFARMVA